MCRVLFNCGTPELVLEELTVTTNGIRHHLDTYNIQNTVNFSANGLHPWIIVFPRIVLYFTS